MLSITKKFEHLKIQLIAIISATNNFAESNCIGRGGFGKVYKGELHVHMKGQATVAIKRLDRKFGQGDPEFWKEIIMLSLYKHENIVSLLGFCDDSDEKILVYEYASKNSLDQYLNSSDLTWVRRLKICIGAAQGLAYLHNPAGTQQRVLHRDIKSSNILLDENWNARIADFGLSKFGPANQQYTFLVSNTVGTIGYCDPIYVETGLLTKESDVYSFGVVLFEVLCGRLCFGNNRNAQSFTEMVRKSYKQNKLSEIIFGNIKDEINPNSLKEYATISYRCLKRDREKRPSMEEVVRVLVTALIYQTARPTPPPLPAPTPLSEWTTEFPIQSNNSNMSPSPSPSPLPSPSNSNNLSPQSSLPESSNATSQPPLPRPKSNKVGAFEEIYEGPPKSNNVNKWRAWDEEAELNF